ncbi:hypothetical protein V7O61_06220 [Methanolobus sp. WCC1]|uniref:hypothetical protein n=1 Tax=unclassified Methanolobus TaxID=2629569 RepID=UPI00258FBC80|nr:hypothetical protein [Methanolobus sp.]
MKLVQEFLINMYSILSNREIATIIWFTLFFAYLVSQKNLRQHIHLIIKNALKTKLLLYFLSYLVFIVSIIIILYNFNFWEVTYLKDTIIWFIFSGLPLGAFVITNKIDNGFWKKLLIENLKLIVIVEFIINSFVFPLIIELFLLPFIVIVVVFNTYAQYYEKGKVFEKPTNIILSLVGLFLLSYSFYMLLSEMDSIVNVSYIKSFLFPVIYSIVSVPYLYFLKVITQYELIFMRLKLGIKRTRKLNLLIKLRLILFCNINIKKLQVATNMNNYNLMSISSKNDIDDMIRSYKLKDKKLEKPTDIEFEIYNYFEDLCNAEWSKVDMNKTNQIVDEYKITQDVAKHYSISKEEVDYIWLKVSEYQRLKN